MAEPKEEFAKRPELQPWNISEDKFPSKGSYHDKLRFFINYAILAPSSHNTQPWLFKVVGNTIELYADRTRGLQVVTLRTENLLSVAAQLCFICF
jgi:hypothetical protein